MGKKNRIVQPGDGQTVQLGLFSAANTGDTRFIEDYPPVYRDEEGFRRVLAGATDMLGTDFEFNTKTLKPTVIGIANYEECAAVWYRPELAAEMEAERIRRGFVYSGHAVLTADRAVLEAQVGYTTPLSAWSDSMLTFWLANSDLCKNPGKETDEEGGLGFMGLGTMVSLTTDLPHHKTCVRGGTKVLLADGTWERIERLVKTKYAGEVVCVDKNGKFTKARVIGWVKTPRLNRKFKRLSYVGYSRNPSDLPYSVFTEDHEVLTPVGWKQIDQLTPGELIATGTPRIPMADMGFLVGCALGDGFQNKKDLRFEIFNSKKQEEYLQLKLRCFDGFERKVTEHSARTENSSPFITVTFNKTPFWTEFSTWGITEFLPYFDLRSLAIWYLDDGYRSVDGLAEIACARLTEVEVDLLVQKINTLGVTAYKRYSKSAGGWRIHFRRKDSIDLFNAIGPWVPPSMRYKVDLNSTPFEESRYCSSPAEVFFAPSVVVDFEDSTTETVYCLEVETHENFITRGGVVHNCRGRNCEELICPRHDVRGYCAIDAYGGLLGDRKCREDLRRRGVPESSITFLHELTELSQRMSQMGVGVDHEYVETLAASMLKDQQKLFPDEGEEGFVFNPRSAKAVTEWGRENKVFFPSTDKGDVQTVLEKLAFEAGFSGEKFDEIQKALAAAEDDGKLDPVLSTVYKLYTYKILGKGTDPWFHPRYFGKDGRLHPRFVTTGTSTGRFSSSTPNCQNIPKRGWGKRVRKAFVPRDKDHVIVEADFSQLELRICLYLAGVDQKIIGADAFSWLVEKSGGLFEKAAQRYGGKPRDIAKSISHAADYLEGLRLYNATELDYTRTRSEIESGALRVYHPKYMPDLREAWTFRGKIVGFTGGNLAQRLFGSKSFENRRKALEIQEDIYFAAFPQIRHWQQKVLREVEDRGYVSSPAGRFLRLNDTPEKDAKVAIAFLGQGVGASHVQSVMLEYWRRHRQVFFAQIHDALCGEFSLSGGYRPIYNRMKEMEMETDLLPGFTCPCKVEVGTDWGSMKDLEEREGQLYLGGEPVE